MGEGDPERSGGGRPFRLNYVQLDELELADRRDECEDEVPDFICIGRIREYFTTSLAQLRDVVAEIADEALEGVKEFEVYKNMVQKVDSELVKAALEAETDPKMKQVLEMMAEDKKNAFEKLKEKIKFWTKLV